MKKITIILSLILILAMLSACTGDSSKPDPTQIHTEDAVKLKSGTYMAVATGSYEATGDYAEIIEFEPSLHLDTEEKSFIYSNSPLISYSQYGSYEISDRKLIATTQDETTYTFEIKDDKTLVMIDDDGLLIDKFIYSEEMN